MYMWLKIFDKIDSRNTYTDWNLTHPTRFQIGHLVVPLDFSPPIRGYLFLNEHSIAEPGKNYYISTIGESDASPKWTNSRGPSEG